MIAAGMLYALVVTLLLSCAAFAMERIFVVRRWPHRHIWTVTLAASLILPGLSMLETGASGSPLASVEARGNASPPTEQSIESNSLSASASGYAISLPRWSNSPHLDSALLGVWALSSLSMLSFMFAARLRLHYIARRWSPAQLDGGVVWIADQIGPAVLGILSPRIIVPRWLLDADSSIRSIALAHERAHIRARDSLLLMIGQFLLTFAPWNLPLWWQLRRLRFAIEVDCDTRVLREGVDTVTYGEALLAVGRRRSQMPLGAVAIAEPVSQLERRIQIMTRDAPRRFAPLAAALFSLTTGFIVCAAQVQPATPDGELRKPPPSLESAFHLGQRFETLVTEKYPRLLSEHYDGTPIVNVLFKDDGSVERSSTDVFSGSWRDFKPTEAGYAKRLNIAPEEVAYVGIQAMMAPVTQGMILIAYTERKRPDRPFVSAVSARIDTQSVDRAIAKRYFADELKHGVPAQEGLWVLLDHNGRVLRTGHEILQDVQLIPLLEKRFSGIKLQGSVTVTPLTDQYSRPVLNLGGRPVDLHCAWLTADSTKPAAP